MNLEEEGGLKKGWKGNDDIDRWDGGELRETREETGCVRERECSRVRG